MNMNNDKWDGAKFMHFMGPDSEHYGGATICYTMIGDDTYLAVAYCHPKDRFVKAYGRAKSFGLLNQLILQPVERSGDYNMYDRLVQTIIPGEPDLEGIAWTMSVDGYERR